MKDRKKYKVYAVYVNQPSDDCWQFIREGWPGADII